ncbi:MBL fold metallo-hydrolase [Quisquiliibacterium transsilvanicum]|uniref:Glyoxylase-like metal-dependent hydrolase (Beta-lactamase superfamily II) n=1 Tax=Quisquiliibacterium transsilvanicum TaxID=1549638 RepID=A0A7W8M9L6_9BURK|nr:MBL fold metallo-hydrolase [Quisquiliibacterium transsilvanicum]MBB5272204.1 glyoxylase-like metal-dependent hydrolase (beta-lactamase superfamily II) [Quisquiliibacterium transsilvanicum]
MKLAIIPVTPFAQNCSLLICEETNRAAVFDPGGDLDLIDQALAETGATLEKVFLTHGHIDHCGQAGEYAKRHGVPLEGPQEEDRFWIQQLPEQGKRFGFARLEAFEPDRWLEDGDTVRFGAQTLQVIHTPGHTPGHVVFVHVPSRLAIVGDVLFQGSIGRTDFPRGNHAELIESITKKLWPLGNDIAFVPGHGPMSTFGEERQHNAFVADDVLEGQWHRG